MGPFPAFPLFLDLVEFLLLLGFELPVFSLGKSEMLWQRFATVQAPLYRAVQDVPFTGRATIMIFRMVAHFSNNRRASAGIG